MTCLVVAVCALIAGIIQSAAGFGAAIFLMLILPHFFGMLSAPALASAIAMCLGVSLAWKFRSHWQIRTCLLPTLVYLAFSVPSIALVKGLDLGLLTPGGKGDLYPLAAALYAAGACLHPAGPENRPEDFGPAGPRCHKAAGVCLCGNLRYDHRCPAAAVTIKRCALRRAQRFFYIFRKKVRRLSSRISATSDRTVPGLCTRA